jgi:hypothetical protein
VSTDLHFVDLTKIQDTPFGVSQLPKGHRDHELWSWDTTSHRTKDFTRLYHKASDFPKESGQKYLQYILEMIQTPY